MDPAQQELLINFEQNAIFHGFVQVDNATFGRGAPDACAVAKVALARERRAAGEAYSSVKQNQQM